MRRTGGWTLAVVAVLVAAGPARAAVLPTGFAEELVANVAGPTSLAFTPDGRMLIGSQRGQLLVYRDGQVLTPPALDLSGRICSNSERGLLGIAVDPAFESNRSIFLYYTFNKSNSCVTQSPTGPVNRVSRFVLGDDNSIDPATETVLIDNIPSFNGNHNGGDLNFGADGLLYVTVGDGGCDYAGGGCAGNNDAARDPHVLLGKVLRVTRDGGIPAGNPYATTGDVCGQTGRTAVGRRCRETFASGLRNPFRMAFQPGGNTFYINDVGQGTWEEIDRGEAGADYGWNIREGHCVKGSVTSCGPPPAGLTNPIFDYGRTTGCTAITGGAFVPSGLWGAPYDGSYLFSDYVCGTIFRLQLKSGGGFTMQPFAQALGASSAVHLGFGPRGDGRALYYTSYANGGEVRRIYRVTGNRPPSANLSANPTSGPAPLTVAFDGSGSSDPDGDTLSYLWDFGDGSGVLTTSEPTVSHTYQTGGDRTATLRVRDQHNAESQPASVIISAGNRPPIPTITAPAKTTKFGVGQKFTLQGKATDPEDGTLGANSLSWTLILHHNDHTHPFLGPLAGTNIAFNAPAPEDLQATEASYVEIRLTATDSHGLAATVSQDFLPEKVAITFATRPNGLRVEVNGFTLTGSTRVTSWKNYRLDVNAPDQDGYLFNFWSDLKPRAHTIVTPAAASSYTAYFKHP
jgi:glucose/arabinose dehydrogenase/PKD repeat protein